MRVTHLSLTNFRNYARLELDLPARPVLVHGANAQGKTSLLEALYYLATSKSPHTPSDRQLINWLANEDFLPFTRVGADVMSERGPRKVEIAVTRESREGNGNGEGRIRKEVRVNGVPRRALDLLGQLNVVLFLPQDIALVDGPPAERRRYLDITLCQVDPAYCHALSRYNRILAQRNALLKSLQDRYGDYDELTFWDDQLVEAGAAVLSGRAIALTELEALSRPIHNALSGGAEFQQVRYDPGFDADPRFFSGHSGQRESSSARSWLVDHAGDRPAIARALLHRLHASRKEELARGMTIWGPHRDDFRLLASGVDLGVYGSRGQQRTAVLALKLAEVAWMRQKTHDWPVLLFDEVLAELDTARRTFLLEHIGGVQQAILTSTDPALFSEDFLKRSCLLRVDAGRIYPESSE